CTSDPANDLLWGIIPSQISAHSCSRILEPWSKHCNNGKEVGSECQKKNRYKILLMNLPADSRGYSRAPALMKALKVKLSIQLIGAYYRALRLLSSNYGCRRQDVFCPKWEKWNDRSLEAHKPQEKYDSILSDGTILSKVLSQLDAIVRDDDYDNER
ncbi:24419_t:CDS:2, partial [Racocetra persica]